MYLSMAIFNTEGYSDNYILHKRVWESFTDNSFLFTANGNSNGIEIVSQSENKPKSSEYLQWVTKEIPSSFLDNNKYFMCLKANVTYRDVATGRRKSILTNEGVENWIRNKAIKNGFLIESAQWTMMGKTTFVKNNVIGWSNPILFMCEIKVTDIDLFRVAFKSGIGSQKRFGYGMMQLKHII